MPFVIFGTGTMNTPATASVGGYPLESTPYNLQSVVLATGSTWSVQPGDVVAQGALWTNVIAVSGNIVFLDSIVPWATGVAIDVYAGIPAHLEFNPDFGGGPGAKHHWREAALLFKSADFTTLSGTFSTDLNPDDHNVATLGIDQSIHPATGSLQPRNIRMLIPLECQRGSRLNFGVWLRDGWRPFKLEGTSLVYTPMSERTSK